MRGRPLQRCRKRTLRADAATIFGALGVALGGCAVPADGGEPQDPMGRSIQAIVGGTASGKDHDAVVVLGRYDDFGMRVGLCTATVIAPNLIVTARHCVSQADPTAACSADGQAVSGGMLHGDRAPATLAIFAPTGGAAPSSTTSELATAKGKALVVDEATNVCNKDLAFVILDRAITTPIAPIRLAPPTMGEALTAVGWGITESGGLPTSRMQRKGVQFVGTGPLAYPDDARYGAGDAEFLVGESACSGDSGSPALAPSGAVVGVASRVGNGQPKDPNNAASTCVGASTHAVYAQLGSANALALRAFKEAGATPWLEGQPDPRTAKDSGGKGRGDAKSTGDALRAPLDVSAAASAMADESPTASGGCSTSSEPTSGAVEQALGFISALAMVLRARKRRPPRDDEREDGNPLIPD